MKKIFAVLLALSMVFALAACTSGSNEPAAEPEVDIFAKGEGVMTYAEYAAADLDTEVTVETFVQATQSWWDNTITAYTQDNEGAYFLYNMACSEEDAAKLVPGTKIKVTGFKSEWSGEVEIVDATFEIEEGEYIAEATDVTALLGTDEMIEHQNQFVAFKGMTVESEAIYKWDGSGGTEVYEAVKGLKAGDTVDLEGFCYWYEGLNPHITSVTVL